MRFLEELNTEQRRAVEAGDGPVLIVAGPGTGKTKTLTTRLAYLLEVQHVPPADIVALTFTNKAAREMRERLGRLPGAEAPMPNVTTFHALGHELLKRTKRDSNLLDEATRTEIIRGLPKLSALKGTSVRELSLLISRAKTSLTAPEEPIAHLLKKYEAALADQGLHDFDDLLCKAHELLKAGNGPAYQHVLVDEFQDTSELQYAMLKLLAAEQNIFAIGDPNQSIYAFRGAGAEMFDAFRADFPQVQTVELTVNYRSCPQVVALANAIFPEAPQLHAHRTDDGSVCALQTLNEFSEAVYVLSEIEQGIGGSTMLSASGGGDVAQPRNYAVLYRTHRAARAVQRAFAESGIPYQVAGEGSPYEQPETQAIIAVLRAVHQPDDAHKQALCVLPALHRPSLTQVNALLAKFQSAQTQTVHDLVESIIAELGFDQDAKRAAALQQLLGSLVQFGTCEHGLAACLEHLNQIHEQEFYDPTVNAATLMTIHASKGLEFKHVFLIAAEEGILPKLTKNDADNIAEERRLFYVAATRAKQTLTILHAKKRAGELAKPSRFISGLPALALPHRTDSNMAALEKRAEKHRLKRAQGTLF